MMVAEILKWDRKTRQKVEELCWDNRLDEHFGAQEQQDPRAVTSAEDCNTVDDAFEAPWDVWDNYIDKMSNDQAKRRMACAAYVSSDVVQGSESGNAFGAHGDVAKGSEGGNVSGAQKQQRRDFIPAMPCIPGDEPHREKLSLRRPVNACVARPVSKSERASNEKARQAVTDEWKRLQRKGTWGTVVRDWNKVAAEAKQTGKEVHFGYLLGLCFEKGSELQQGDEGRKYKGRASRATGSSTRTGKRLCSKTWARAPPPWRQLERRTRTGVCLVTTPRSRTQNKPTSRQT